MATLIAIMLAALLFFPFRVNSTLLMTALNMGLVEAMYLRNRDLIKRRGSWNSGIGLSFVPLTLLVLVGLVWFVGIKPLKGELAFFQYKRAAARESPKEAEAFIQEALRYDPKNSTYCLYASQLYLKEKEFTKARDLIERALIDFNGDLTKWSVYYAQGLLNFQTGSLFEAKEAFAKSVYYNPNFEAGRKKLEEVTKIIEDHDQIVIKIR